MPKPILFLLVVVFLVTGLAASALNRADAHPTRGALPDTQTNTVGTSVERCVLQPLRVRHPDNGAPLLVLRPSC